MLLSANFAACGDSKSQPGNAAGGAAGSGGNTLGGTNETGGSAVGTGGVSSGGVSTGGVSSSYVVGSGIGGSGFNQCGVAAPLPKNTGQCTSVTSPLIANFDDYTGGSAASYTYRINATSANPILGGILHIGDGSDTGDAGSIVTTQMVPGEGGSGYALQISNTEALHWGGLLMFYVPSAGACIDAQAYSGVQFSIKGSSPSGNFGVNLSMLDTTPGGDNGLCANATSTDCKDPAIQFALPADASTWKQIQIPWSAFTPGIGSAVSCVPVTGQNIVRIVVAPFMNYPPPNYTFQPGAYQIAVDNLTFY